MDGEEGGGNSFGFLSNDPPFPANSSTPFILDVISDSRGGGAVSEDITFNSNDGLSFADDISLSDDEEKGSRHQLSSSNKTVQPSPKAMVQGRERLIQMTSPPVAARPYEAGPDSDSESLMTHNDGEELSEMEGLNEFGILLDQKINNPQQQLPPKNPLHRPKSAAGGGSAPARSSTRSVSGIPRPIRSRSNSLTSNDSGGQSRRNSSELSSSRLPPRVDMDKSFDCFVQRSKDFNFYNSGVVNTILLSLEKKMQVTNLNAEFMVSSYRFLLYFNFCFHSKRSLILRQSNVLYKSLYFYVGQSRQNLFSFTKQIFRGFQNYIITHGHFCAMQSN